MKVKNAWNTCQHSHDPSYQILIQSGAMPDMTKPSLFVSFLSSSLSSAMVCSVFTLRVLTYPLCLHTMLILYVQKATHGGYPSIFICYVTRNIQQNNNPSIRYKLKCMPKKLFRYPLLNQKR